MQLLACVFYAVGHSMNELGEKSWITAFDEGVTADPDTPVLHAYTISLLWAIGLVCGQGTEVQPEN
jgi:hypothetical protein